MEEEFLAARARAQRRTARQWALSLIIPGYLDNNVFAAYKFHFPLLIGAASGLHIRHTHRLTSPPQSSEFSMHFGKGVNSATGVLLRSPPPRSSNRAIPTTHSKQLNFREDPPAEKGMSIREKLSFPIVLYIFPDFHDGGRITLLFCQFERSTPLDPILYIFFVRDLWETMIMRQIPFSARNRSLQEEPSTKSDSKLNLEAWNIDQVTDTLKMFKIFRIPILQH